MQDQTPLTPAQRELEQAFRSAAPSAARLDPLAAAFTAGRRSTRRQLRTWQSATALALLVAITPHFLPTTNHPAPKSEPTLLTASTTPPTPIAPVTDQSILVLQESVTQRGLDGLPPRRAPILRPLHANDKL